ncbi:YutD family protein [Alkalicoccobacillus plakortidis]|uniref:YutD family protein n=1 Tax=Alkalicoccobacillus plakortidis TaxID=444060 RepID=A0ABT0XHW2_9BACI|nr:YutD family protein [Alkalicoccobacillus plakortidis]MCM2675474.1 YutD family protein [Alkalicoccobacillus plakortidis]
MVTIQELQFEVVEDIKEGWDEEAFKSRYSDILNKYDYIVGDWGYNQLRLRGFFEDKHKKSTYDSKISTLPDYLYEYCNFGCAYFVVKRVKKRTEKGNKSKQKEGK